MCCADTFQIYSKGPHFGFASLRTDRHARGTLEFAPANPGAFYRTEDCFPDAVTEHRPINQAHRQDAPGSQNWLVLENAGECREDDVHGQEGYDEWHYRQPCAEWQRGEQKQIYHWRDGDEDDLEKPDARQTEPAERAIVPVEYHVAMFPKTLQRAVGPAKTLPRERAHAFGRFRPGDRAGHIDDPLSMFVQRQREVGIFCERLQTQTACFIDRIFANGTDCAGHDRNAIPT